MPLFYILNFHEDAVKPQPRHSRRNVPCWRSCWLRLGINVNWPRLVWQPSRSRVVVVLVVTVRSVNLGIPRGCIRIDAPVLHKCGLAFRFFRVAPEIHSPHHDERLLLLWRSCWRCQRSADFVFQRSGTKCVRRVVPHKLHDFLHCLFWRSCWRCQCGAQDVQRPLNPRFPDVVFQRMDSLFNGGHDAAFT